MSAKQAILDSHTTSGLATASHSAPPNYPHAAPTVLAGRGLTAEDLSVSDLPSPHGLSARPSRT